MWVESVSRMCIRAHFLHASVRGAVFLKKCVICLIWSGCLFRHSFCLSKWESAHFRLESKRVESSRRQSRMRIRARFLHASVRGAVFLKEYVICLVSSGYLFRHSFCVSKWESAHFRLESKRVGASRRQSRMCISAYNLHASVRGALFLKSCVTFVVLSGCLFRHSFYVSKWESAHSRLESKRVESSRRHSRMRIRADVLHASVRALPHHPHHPNHPPHPHHPRHPHITTPHTSPHGALSL